MTSNDNPIRVEMLDRFHRLRIIYDPEDGDYAWEVEVINEYGEGVRIYGNDEWHPTAIEAYVDAYLAYVLER